MNTYTVDKAKELIITSNPLWNRYVSLCGVVTSDEFGNMYLANEQGSTMIRIEDYFKEQLREYLMPELIILTAAWQICMTIQLCL